jgi:plasmid stabilization system protein ParE
LRGHRAHLEWSHEALGDLRRLHRFLSPRSLRSADRAVVTIREAINLLRDFPEAGRIAEDSLNDRRELLVPFGDSGYVVAYGIRGDVIEILAIHHQREAGY